MTGMDWVGAGVSLPKLDEPVAALWRRARMLNDPAAAPQTKRAIPRQVFPVLRAHLPHGRQWSQQRFEAACRGADSFGDPGRGHELIAAFTGAFTSLTLQDPTVQTLLTDLQQRFDQQHRLQHGLSPTAPPVEVVARSKREAYERLREKIRPWTKKHTVLSLWETHHVGHDRLPTRHETTVSVRADEDGVASRWYFFLLHDEQARAEHSAEVQAGSGCRLGRVLVEPPDLAVAELVFDRPPLRRGETYALEYKTIFSYAKRPPPAFHRAMPPNCREVILRVQFDPTDLPADAWKSHWPTPGELPVDLAHLNVGEQGLVVAQFTDPEPGDYGIRWSWPNP